MAGDGTVTPGNFASVLLAGLGLPTTPAWQQAVGVWVKAESGSNPAGWRNNNPLNAKCSPQHQAFNVDVGVLGCDPQNNTIMFASLSSATQSYINQLKVPGTTYAPILKAATPIGFLNSISLSKWDTGHYGYYSGSHDVNVPGQGTAKGLAGLYVKEGGSTSPTADNSQITNPNDFLNVTTPLGNVEIQNPFAGLLDIWSGITGAIGNAALILMGGLLILLGVWSLLKQQSIGQTFANGANTLAVPSGALLSYAAGRQRRVPKPRFAFQDAPAAPEPSVPAEEAITGAPSATPPVADSETGGASLIEKQINKLPRHSSVVYKGESDVDKQKKARLDFIKALRDVDVKRASAAIERKRGSDAISRARLQQRTTRATALRQLRESEASKERRAGARERMSFINALHEADVKRNAQLRERQQEKARIYKRAMKRSNH